LDKNSESENKSKNIISSVSNQPKELSSIERILITILRRKRIFLLTIISFLVFGYIRTAKEVIVNSLYQGNFTLLIKDPISSVSKGAPSGDVSSMFELNSSIDQDIPTLRKLLLSEFILRNLASKFSLSTEDLASRIKIKEDFTAKGVLDIFLTSKNPKDDEKLLNELSYLYVNYATKQKQQELSDGISFLNSQEPAIKKRVIELRDKLEIYMQKNNLVDPLVEIQNKKSMIENLRKEISDLKIQNQRLNDIKENILRGELVTALFTEDITALLGPSLEINNPESQIANQYETLNKELADALLIYTPTSSIVKNIKARIDDLKPLIREKQLITIDKAIKSNRENTALNELRIVELDNEFKDLTTLIKEYAVLEFELEGATLNLSGLNNAKERLQFELAQNSTPWTIIKKPSFRTTRIYPSFKRELINFAFFGIFSGIGLVLLRDKFDNVYHSPKEIESEIKVPILGNVPYVEYFADVREHKKSILEVFTGDNDLNTIDSYDKFFYQEALRNIYTSIRFANTDKSLKVIVLTSSIPKEGKSLTNILLAKTLCEMDLKVLQIDADLRKPQLHLRLGLNNITGLSNILTDKEIKISEATQKIPGFENWDVITSGTIPPDATRLLQSERMDNFIKDLKKNKNYDLVLIDAPPIIGLADSVLVAEKSDGLILLVSTDQVPRNLPKESINRVADSGAYLIGMITNETKKPTAELINNYQYGSYNFSYTYNAYMDVDDNENKQIKEQNKFEKIKEFLKNKVSPVITKIFNWLDK
tara:strand:+ start:4040 stop:6340 length:2301 start_codon:yes stop_codon:yes gene_type:complete